ncbi:LuxR C-terminal-related transcriptional regulator [Streptomyces sp. NPDC045431]|uniref:response regulator transcription factor n=1 Tax=Streptomyces sp. NPDC045431 TaxID=3155613 RepID=UPI0033D28833
MSSARTPRRTAWCTACASWRGQRFIDPEFALVALDAGENPLTRREVQVLGMAADGTPTREIAERLSLSVATVRNHLSAPPVGDYEESRGA